MSSKFDIPLHEVQRRFNLDNPWWRAGQGIDVQEQAWPRRDYFESFAALALQTSVKRALVLIGPRRVGKTVMLKHLVAKLLDTPGIVGTQVLYVSLDTPLYSGRSLESLVQQFIEMQAHPAGQPLWVLFDEIQYLKDWEVHLKSLVDSYPQIRFLASGSATAVLRMASRESGAGRFTEFILPPLTFAEYLHFVGLEASLIALRPGSNGQTGGFHAPDINGLNVEFVNYLNYGGFPEAVMNPAVRADPTRFLRQDIVDKVLLKDLPSLYGIGNTQELNRFFNVLAFNTGNEVSLEELSKHAGISKARLSDYLEYMEAAYLIRRVHRIDDNALRLLRARTFKVYLVNPCMRAALFGMVTVSDEAMGRLAETAVWSQWLHSAAMCSVMHYARWREGRQDMEVDLVALDERSQKPSFAVEVKWSDRTPQTLGDLRALHTLALKHPLARPPLVTTRSYTGQVTLDGMVIDFVPVALYCYATARQS